MAKKSNFSSYNRFDFVGKIYEIKDGYKSYETERYIIENLKFRIKCGNNSHRLEVTSFQPKNPSETIRVLTPDGAEEIPFDRRTDYDEEKLSYLYPSIKVGDSSYKFVSNVDFLKMIKNILATRGTKNNTFRITGNIEYQRYKSRTGEMKEISKYVPVHITEVDENTECRSYATLNLYLPSNSLRMFGNKYITINGKALVYNGKKEGDFKYDGYNVMVDVPEMKNPEKIFKALSHIYTGDDNQMKKIKMTVEVIDGAKEVALTMDMLSEDERELINLGLKTFDDFKKTKGNGIGEIERKLVRINEEKEELTAVRLEDVEFDDVKKFRQSTPPTFDFNNPPSTNGYSAVEDDDIPF